jgi:hypothetical protein
MSGNYEKTKFLYNGIVEVTGSIPVGSTNRMQGLVGLTANPFIVP